MTATDIAAPRRLSRGPYKPRVQAAEAPAAAPADQQAQAIQQAQRALYAAKRALKVKQARAQGAAALRAFIELMMPDPEAPDDPDRSLFACRPHHRILMDMVAEIEAKLTLRAACSMPPQHGKSLILSRYGLAWIIGRNPHLRVLVATYADSLAQTRGDELREVLQSRAFREVFPKAVLKKGSQAKDEMVFVAGGSVNLLGRGTGTTGRPCDLFLIDDPYKDDEEASSPTIRQKVKDWYAGVVYSRCHVLTPILIVHTRWNEDDLLGWLVDPEHPDNRADPERPKKWKYINLPTPVTDPALAEALGIEVGEALWPERFPVHHLKEAEKNSPRLYAALYRGQPAPEDGDMFKVEHFHTYLPHELPRDLRIYAASDHAVSEKQRADATCFGAVGVDAQDNIWLLPDLFWKRAATDVVVEAMIDLMKAREPLWWRASSDHISKSIGPFLRKRMLERRTFCNIVEGPEQGDKVKKAQAIQARYAMGKVRFPAGAPWLMQAKHELLKFPHAKHDDFVDFLSHIGRGLRVMWGAPAIAKERTGQAANENGPPKVGTLGWIKFAAQQERRQSDTLKRLRSM